MGWTTGPRQEVINRLQFTQPLPPGVTPQISPESPTGEIYRYSLLSPKDALGRDIYTLSDLKALQDWTLERDFRRVPRIVDITSYGGTVKRYEIHPDPEKLSRYGISLQQLQNAIGNANSNVGGDYLFQGPTVENVRGIGLIGGGLDPMKSKRLFEAKGPQAASAFLRAEENHRLQEIRNIVVTSVNNHPIKVDDLVEGGPLLMPDDAGRLGVVVNHQTRLGKVGVCRPKKDAHGQEVRDAKGNIEWLDEDDKVQSIVLLRQHEDSLPALSDIEKKVQSLNESPGQLLPGVQIEPYYDRTDLIHITAETVRENLLLGMTLVTAVLLMFLSNVRTAIVVAINIPLALLFAFGALFLRGKSANLLSIGAVDFGIIVDSSVIMVENIYRHLATGEESNLPIKTRILHSIREIDRALLFSTAIMVCAFIPLFTMRGPEGQLFGPMAETYAFALGGGSYWRLSSRRSSACSSSAISDRRPIISWSGSEIPLLVAVADLPRPPLDNAGGDGGSDGLHGNASAEDRPGVHARTGRGQPLDPGGIPREYLARRDFRQGEGPRSIMRTYAEVEDVVTQIGRPDDGTDTAGFYNAEFFVNLRPQKNWLAQKPREGWATLFGPIAPAIKRN